MTPKLTLLVLLLSFGCHSQEPEDADATWHDFATATNSVLEEDWQAYRDGCHVELRLDRVWTCEGRPKNIGQVYSLDLSELSRVWSLTADDMTVMIFEPNERVLAESAVAYRLINDRPPGGNADRAAVALRIARARTHLSDTGVKTGHMVTNCEFSDVPQIRPALDVHILIGSETAPRLERRIKAMINYCKAQ